MYLILTVSVYSDPDPLAETNSYPELALDLALGFVFDNPKSSVLRDPQRVTDGPWKTRTTDPQIRSSAEKTPNNTGSNPQGDLPPSGPVPAVLLGGHCPADLARRRSNPCLRSPRASCSELRTSRMLSQQRTLRDLNCRESSIPSALGMVIAGSPGPGEHVGRRCRRRGPPGRRG